MAGPVADEGASLGQMLRARREARGLSQEQAAQRARVQMVFVRALEDDDYHLLPDAHYLSRFVFEYATFLGLDQAVADAAFRRQFQRKAGPGPLYRAVPRLAALPWRRLLGATAVVLALVPLAYILLSLAGKEPDQPPPPPPAALPADAEREGPTERERSLGGEPVPARDAAPERRLRHRLVIRARELAWLAVRVDGGPEQEVLLREGEMARWGAEQGFLLTVGNAGGVELLLDGRPVPLPARRGEVIRDLELPANPRLSP